jgi:hypothetical protein
MIHAWKLNTEPRRSNKFGGFFYLGGCLITRHAVRLQTGKTSTKQVNYWNCCKNDVVKVLAWNVLSNIGVFYAAFETGDNLVSNMMKTDSLFAAVAVSRGGALGKKFIYIGAAVLCCVAGGVFYWQHFLHFMPLRKPVVVIGGGSAVSAPVAGRATAKVVPPPAPTEAAKPVSEPAKIAAVVAVAAPAVSKPVEAIAIPSLFVSGKSSAKTPATPGVEIVAQPARPVVAKAPVRRLSAEQAEEVKLSQAAQLAFGNVMDLAGKYPDNYGFVTGDLLTEARLGNAIPIYTIAESDRAGYHAGQPVRPLLKLANQWVFPVFIGNQIRCMVQVSRAGNNFVPGSGSKVLALAWNKIQEKWPAAKGYHPELIVNPAVPGYYFTVPELATQNITDINDLLYNEGRLSPAAVILASWR